MTTSSVTDTSTASTKAQYCLVAERLCKQFALAGQSWEQNPPGFAAWFEKRAQGMKPATVRLYKAALLHALHHGPMELLDRIRAVQGNAQVPPRTSARKQKKVEPSTLMDIAERLQPSRSKFRNVVLFMLYCNCLLGLRPMEWDQARLSGEHGDQLLIRSCKHSHGRGRTGERCIDLQSFGSEFQTAVQQLLTELRVLKQEYLFAEIYRSARRLLLSVQTGPYKVSLYSTRHQAVANMKRAGVNKETMAIFLGHSSVKTAQTHYASKKSGFRELPDIIARDIDPAPEPSAQNEHQEKR